MVAAIVLINVERARVDDVAQHLLKFSEVSEVFSVAGQYDLVVIVRAHTNEEIADCIAGKVRGVPFITRTETLIAFKTYAPEDMDRMFSIGNDEPKG
ncbi:MAG: Lrp/AsnC ligand binding domain-containing protein [Anaerolinea sp.]|nr:Lrp/AsnC ligand binding domain-containing protein [Anaerolinea sp.]MCC6973013.1 Lrp/AsnC ligand binding domain-containing protein [Anaerolineae bacterium]CAG1011356.1 hypothetical protein ANRL4_04388 [Anaerolineae bacterium]